MNYSVHAIMYTYFLLTAIPAYRASVLRCAPLITSLQIAQFAWGTVHRGAFVCVLVGWVGWRQSRSMPLRPAPSTRGFGLRPVQAVNVFAAVAYLRPGVGCAIQPQILYIGALMYLLCAPLSLTRCPPGYPPPCRLGSGAMDVPCRRGRRRALCAALLAALSRPREAQQGLRARGRRRGAWLGYWPDRLTAEGGLRLGTCLSLMLTQRYRKG